MPSFTKEKLSASTDGEPIAITATATAGTAIHTATAGTTDWDEIWLYAANISASEVTLTLEWGGVAAGNNIIVKVPAESVVQVAPGFLLQNAQALAAFASVTAVINITGWVNRIA